MNQVPGGQGEAGMFIWRDLGHVRIGDDGRLAFDDVPPSGPGCFSIVLSGLGKKRLIVGPSENLLTSLTDDTIDSLSPGRSICCDLTSHLRDGGKAQVAIATLAPSGPGIAPVLDLRAKRDSYRPAGTPVERIFKVIDGKQDPSL